MSPCGAAELVAHEPAVRVRRGVAAELGGARSCRTPRRGRPAPSPSRRARPPASSAAARRAPAGPGPPAPARRPRRRRPRPARPGVPLAMPAATSASCAGLISTSPWPMASAAFVVPVLSAGHAAAEDADRQLPVGADAVGRGRLGERAVGQLERLLDEGRVAGLRERLGEAARCRGRTGPRSRTRGRRRPSSRGRAPGCPGSSGAGGQQRGRRHRLHARAGREVAGEGVAGVGRLVRGDGEDLAGARPDDDQVRRQGLRRRRRRRRRSARPGRAASAAACPASGATDVDLAAPRRRCSRRCSPRETVKPGRAGELLLEGPLQPGEPELVAGGVPRRRRPPGSPR